MQVCPQLCIQGLKTGVLLQKSSVSGSWNKAEYSERRVLICSLLTRTLTEKGEK